MVKDQIYVWDKALTLNEKLVLCIHGALINRDNECVKKSLFQYLV